MLCVCVCVCVCGGEGGEIERREKMRKMKDLKRDRKIEDGRWREGGRVGGTPVGYSTTLLPTSYDPWEGETNLVCFLSHESICIATWRPRYVLYRALVNQC